MNWRLHLITPVFPTHGELKETADVSDEASHSDCNSELDEVACSEQFQKAALTPQFAFRPLEFCRGSGRPHAPGSNEFIGI